MSHTKILIVDDDPDIALILKDNLELDGYEVQVAENAKQALSLFNSQKFDLMMLDLALPDIDGIQVCRRIREKSDVPIIMLTARDRVPDKVLGFECGADDYVVKPFDYLELEARIKACLRRTSRTTIPSCQVIEIGKLKIDVSGNRVWKDNIPINLTKREFAILVLLAGNPGIVFERSVIREKVWPGGDLYSDSRTIDVHVQHLRSKLEDKASNPKYIQTVQGVGYIFYVEQD
ncbi:MAG: response regulator transcription factor [Syntrophaceae bacterium]|nr:response regulator transcription factor [Syntrophaceae bacterium]